MNVNLSVPALEKLVDYAASGIGSTAAFLFSPMRAKRDAQVKLIAAEAEAKAQRILAEGRADSMKLIAKAQADARSNLVSPNAVVSGELDFGELVQQRIQFQEEKRQSNIKSVLLQAAEELADKEVDDHEVDHDWAARFFSEVQDVSSAELQELWAKVLAGEVEHPGNTSIKTVGMLKNLDKNVAALFRTLCSTCLFLSLDGTGAVGDKIAALGRNSDGNALEKYGLGFAQLNMLNEHGLIISDYDSWRDFRASTGMPIQGPNARLHYPFRFQGKFWILNSTVQAATLNELKIHGVALTRSGQELSKVVELETVEQYALDLRMYFKKMNLSMVEVTSWKPQLIEDDNS